MDAVKIDRTKLKTVANYAKERGVSKQTIWNWINNNEVKTAKIDGVTFVIT